MLILIENGKKEIIEAILNKPKELRPSQKRAVISDRKYLRIIAGAGAGKCLRGGKAENI